MKQGKKKIVILGSTGSIGRQALSVIDLHKDIYQVIGLSAYANIDLLLQQIKDFKPAYVTVVDKLKAEALRKVLPDSVHVYDGFDGLKRLASQEEADIILISVVGIAGLEPTLAAIEAGKDVALATKEALVTGGHLINKALQKNHSRLIPVDSEHSAVFQCMKASANPSKEVRRIILTASGGPFRGWTMERLKSVTPEQALRHPNWDMGSRITIDSATLMNKGFEIIEASWLFTIDPTHIEVVVHPQSIVHSMVEFIDGSVVAQLGMPDMRTAIGYALSYPQRLITGVPLLDVVAAKNLTFEKPDIDTFRCLALARQAMQIGGTMPVVLNAADEMAVSLFLKGKIGFLDIAVLIEQAMQRHKPVYEPSLEEIYAADKHTRRLIQEMIEG